LFAMVTKEAAVVLLLLSVTGFVNGQEPWTMLGISNEFEVCWERCFQVTANCFVVVVVVVVVVQKFQLVQNILGCPYRMPRLPGSCRRAQTMPVAPL
jgi:hypothetical protein